MIEEMPLLEGMKITRVNRMSIEMSTGEDII
jgi:hypothetical protein